MNTYLCDYDSSDGVCDACIYSYEIKFDCFRTERVDYDRELRAKVLKIPMMRFFRVMTREIRTRYLISFIDRVRASARALEEVEREGGDVW